MSMYGWERVDTRDKIKNRHCYGACMEFRSLDITQRVLGTATATLRLSKVEVAGRRLGRTLWDVSLPTLGQKIEDESSWIHIC